MTGSETCPLSTDAIHSAIVRHQYQLLIKHYFYAQHTNPKIIALSFYAVFMID